MLASVASMIDQFNMKNISLLKDLGYEVDVAGNFETGSTSSNERVLAFKEELKGQGVRSIQLPIPRKISAIGDILQSYKMVKKLVETEEYQIVHCHSPIGGVITRLACRKQRKKGLKVIYTAHGFHFFTGASWKNWLVFYPIEKWMARYTDVLITICKEDFNRARNKMSAKKIIYSPGVGIDTNTIKEMPVFEDKRKELGISEDEKIIYSIGELNKNKNHEVIIRALGALKRRDVHYVICGKGDLDGYLLQVAREVGIEANVHLLGFRTDAKEWLNFVDIFAFPSYREGLPVSLMEAMAAGLPVVCSNIRGNVDLIEEEKGGFRLSPEDISRFSEKIAFLLEQPELCHQFGLYNQNTVEQFDHEKVQEVMKRVYSQMNV